jgi:hypothetical protein
MAWLVRANYGTTVLGQVARTSRAMTSLRKRRQHCPSRHGLAGTGQLWHHWFGSGGPDEQGHDEFEETPPALLLIG